MPFDLDAVTAPFRMQPGLRRLAAGAVQLTPNRPGDRHLVEKLAVLRAAATEALLAQDGFDASPALRALLAQASSEHPQALAWDGAGRVEARHLGWSLHGDALQGEGPAEIGAGLAALPAPWRLAGLLSLAFAEDFAVIDGASACIPWMAVCLPSHWSPREKVGRHFAAVHAPVADNQLLLAAAPQLARLVTGPERWERFVWTVTTLPTLDMHPARVTARPWPPGADAEALAARAFFRTEHQTFVPLPERGQAVFTIHVESLPLVQAIATRDAAERLHAAIASMSPAVLAYRGLADARDRLLAWLSERP